MNSSSYPNLFRWRHRSFLGLMTLAAAGVTSASAHADIVRITSVNGDYEASHAEQIDIRPGDTVSLSADVFTDSADGNYAPQNRYAEDFVWTADDKDADECDASQGQACLGPSNFEVNDYGVSFYVPNDFAGQQITVRVRSSSTYGAEDTIVLNNAALADNNSDNGGTDGTYTPPTEVVTDPEQYNNTTVDPDVALAGHGRWVIIGGVRYFVPYSYKPDWVPYQNGYWSWTDDGWTWISNDPWGWMTDHYGAWRHHVTYGWIWLPFGREEFRWHPHCVSWFHDGGEHVGWYPYYDGYRNAYRHGREMGFNDGYWAGYNAGNFYGHEGWVGGHTCIHGRDFGAPNIWAIRLREAEGLGYWRHGFEGHFYGGYPGYGRVGDWRASRGWAEGGFHVRIPETRIEGRRIGGIDLRYPVRIHPVPGVDARPPYIGAGSLHRPFPVGSVFHPGAGAGHPVFTPPTRDGRGIAIPPRVYDPAHGVYHPLPPRTAHPVAPNPQNPIYHPVPVSAHPGQPPVYHPGQPVVNPHPHPAPPAFHPPVNHPGQPPVNHPGQPPVNHPGQPPVNHPGQPPVNHPGQPPVNHPGQPPVNHPGQPPVNHPGQPPVNHPGQPPVNHPGQPPVNHPGQPPVNHPGQPPVNHPGQPPVFHPAPPVSHPNPPVNHPAPPVFHPAPPVSHPNPPVNHPAPPVFHPAPPVSHPAPPVSHPAPPVFHPAPPVSHPAPPVNHPAPPVFHPAPPVSHPAPPVSHPAPGGGFHPAPGGGGHGPHHPVEANAV